MNPIHCNTYSTWPKCSVNLECVWGILDQKSRDALLPQDLPDFKSNKNIQKSSLGHSWNLKDEEVSVYSVFLCIHSYFFLFQNRKELNCEPFTNQVWKGIWEICTEFFVTFTLVNVHCPFSRKRNVCVLVFWAITHEYYVGPRWSFYFSNLYSKSTWCKNKAIYFRKLLFHFF